MHGTGMFSLNASVLRISVLNDRVSIIQELASACTSDPGNPEFWNEVRRMGKALSLIGQSEAKKHGGLSDISDDLAEKVMNSYYFCVLCVLIVICPQFME